MKLYRFSWVAVLLLTASCKPMPDKMKIGGPAPELKLEHLLQAPSESLSGWKSLKGKAAILEFWATWCDPCVEEIPHWNKMAERFQDKPIVFISITDESRDKITAFLKDHAMNGWVATDAKSLFRSFEVFGRPKTVLVDARGRVAGVTYPASLRDQDIEDLIAGKPLPESMLTDMNSEFTMLPPSTTGQALMEARVSSAKDKKMYLSMSEESFHARSATAEFILSQAFDTNQARIKIEPTLPDLYDVDVVIPRSPDAQISASGRRRGERLRASPDADLKAMLQNILLTGLSLKLHRQTRVGEVYVFSRIRSTAGLKVAKAKTGHLGFSSGPGRITASGMSLKDLSDALEDKIGRPVIDETGLKDRYEFELTWDIKQKDSLKTALEIQLGLRATPTQRPAKFLVFKGKKKAGIPHP